MSGAKEYLMKIRWYDVLIDSKLEELERLNAMVRRITPVMSDAGGAGGGNADRLGDTVAKIVDLREEINRDIDEFVNYKREAKRLMCRLDNPDYYRVLHMRYLQNKSIKEISMTMKYSYDGMKRFHSAALQRFEKVLEEDKKSKARS